MRDDPTPPFLARWRRQSRAEPRAQEPADLGNRPSVWELTLDPSLESELRGPAAAPADTGWLQRWRSGGRGPA